MGARQAILLYGLPAGAGGVGRGGRARHARPPRTRRVARPGAPAQPGLAPHRPPPRPVRLSQARFFVRGSLCAARGRWAALCNRLVSLGAIRDCGAAGRAGRRRAAAGADQGHPAKVPPGRGGPRPPRPAPGTNRTHISPPSPPRYKSDAHLSPAPNKSGAHLARAARAPRGLSGRGARGR